MNEIIPSAKTMVLPDDYPDTLALTAMEHAGLGTQHNGLFQPGKDRRIYYWNQDFYVYERCVYRKVKMEQLSAEIGRFLNQILVESGRTSKRLRATKNVKSEVIEQIKNFCTVNVERMPAWLDGAGRPKPTNVIAFQNGWIDASQLVDNPHLLPNPPTPDWFSESVSACSYDPHAKCPLWIRFLNETLGDSELIGQIQEWFGYCLTSDTSLQKMLWLHGVSGAGKSTIIKVMQAVVGERNCTSFNLWDLAKEFTLSSFLGKTLAISHDAELERTAESANLLGQIKSITGEDDRYINRKMKEGLTEKLLTRIVVCVNKFPPIKDEGNTLKRRMLIIPFERSFTGKADPRLYEKLLAELPGITTWSINGLQRLRQRGHFLDTTKGLVTLEEFSINTNPLLVFIQDCLVPSDEVKPDAGKPPRISKQALYKVYRKWCQEFHTQHPLDHLVFCRRLKESMPTIREYRRPGKGRPRMFEGIQLTRMGQSFEAGVDYQEDEEIEEAVMSATG